jgi:hypothetical protein
MIIGVEFLLIDDFAVQHLDAVETADVYEIRSSPSPSSTD